MNYITATNLKKSYGERTLFEGLDFAITEGQKIALIAKNGTGKTSLLNILAQLDESDGGGTVVRDKNAVIEFLPQTPILNDDLTVEQTIFAYESPILKVVENYEKALRNPENETAYQEAFEAMDKNNAWVFEQHYKQLLSQLKITNLEQKVGTLSGGQKKRVALAHTLISKPDMLLLDEPTNHLDLEMIEWLENYLDREKMTLFMVTHDRYFLERVCNEIWELDEQQLFSYKGNYSYFLEKKEERLQQQDMVVEKAQNLYKKELEWMRRQPKARGTKSKSRITRFYDTKELAHLRREQRNVEIEIQMERLGSKIIKFDKVCKQFDTLTILKDFSYNFQKGERVGIVGNNGTGKTTFLNILTEKEPIDKGEIEWGETVKFGYYTQKGLQIKAGQKVIEVIKEVADYIPLSKGRQLSAEQLLERFLFSRKQQYDFVENLSGGEQKRLNLCRILMTNPNFLILDEPTNDLDIVTLNILEEFLMNFEGCLLVVSHDRYFMDKMVDHLFVFEGNGQITDFVGNYTEYRLEQSQQKETTTPKVEKAEKPKKVKTKLSYKEQQEYDKLLSEIEKLEELKARLEEEFNNLSTPDAITEHSQKYEKVNAEIDTKTERWLELEELIESFEKN
ncbi:MAG: ABC-F family ATP-binding cassette domain-containing protein [Flavobacteriaceae bacterium]|nr:ABC-F family ATP-binding cassette domain-containing protein [Flavobacteriaceae bacterium]